ncbi:SDR family NAD(P)-dependent oxidoreductase [Herbaspirillum frisingense]|uniref:SDR family NAD(P)-dependent oxidoreductase n=1 Tax=Herbaspirillum frisingense TaxID=92645 RepID=UPI001F160EA8|nr:SDR family oxidoreductase [Herbaspirillum frisingense]UIN21217.1 SDR family oxidoreductase [Herbaspirillum frisingense]
MKYLQNQLAVVTGGGSGIGRATSIALASCGAHTIVIDMSEESAKETCDAIVSAGGKASFLIGSVADPKEVARLFAQVDDIGALDILVNNAGISGNRPALEITDEEWRTVMGVNLDGVFFCAREAGRRMTSKGRGTIINIGSIYSVVAAPNRLSYCASKAAVEMMTRSLAIEWAEAGVRVNGVAPGYVDTPLIQSLSDEGRLDLKPLLKRTPLGRLATPEDIAGVVAFLCEPRAAYITGQMLPVDGGWTAYGYV